MTTTRIVTDSTNCYKCGTELINAPGIGPFCPNKECDVVDATSGNNIDIHLDEISRRGMVMNKRIIKIGLESGMLNYVDNETPRHYFLSGHADEQDLAKFAHRIIQECAEVAHCNFHVDGLTLGGILKKHFGVEL